MEGIQISFKKAQNALQNDQQQVKKFKNFIFPHFLIIIIK